MSEQMIKIEAQNNLSEFPNAVFAQDNFRNLEDIAKAENFFPISGILFDLGFSSYELESLPGLSFNRESKLDMRYSPDLPYTAADLLRRLPEKELADIIYKYGEERNARRIAKKIIEIRKKKPIETTTELVDLIKSIVPYKGIHPATRTFQALRIAVNDELGALKEALPQAVDLLEKNGIIMVISFHSLEDRIVKHFLKEQEDLKIITKKPIQTTREEIVINPKARSAKLRVAQKL